MVSVQRPAVALCGQPFLTFFFGKKPQRPQVRQHDEAPAYVMLHKLMQEVRRLIKIWEPESVETIYYVAFQCK